jgi:hypothetical protein
VFERIINARSEDEIIPLRLLLTDMAYIFSTKDTTSIIDEFVSDPKYKKNPVMLI